MISIAVRRVSRGFACLRSAVWGIATFLTFGGLTGLQAQTVNSQGEARFVYVGTYTHDAPGGWSASANNEPPKGVTVYSVGAGMGDLSLVQTVPSANPSFVAIHPSQNYLYVSNEILDFEGKENGSIEAYAIDDTTGELTFISRVPTGAIPAQIAVDPKGKYLAVATYIGATFEILPINANGGLAEAVSVLKQTGSGPHDRQEAPHPHAVVFDPGGNYIATADLGTDWVRIFSYSGTTLEEVSAVQMAPGSGPRHVSFHPDGEVLYIINELTADIAAYAFDPETGTLGEQIQLISTVPENFPPHASTAEIMVHPSGKFLYASNRKFEDHDLADSIVTYSIDPAGYLRLVGFTTHEDIRFPRAFNIDPTGSWLYAMGQKSDAIVQYYINPETGALTSTGLSTDTKVPVSMAFKQ